MPHLLGVIIAIIFAITFRSILIKKETASYVISLVISLGLYFLGLEVQGTTALESFIPTGLFVVVMYTGLLSSKHKLRSIRRQLSIIAFILIVPHVLIYLLDFLKVLFTSVNILTLVGSLIGLLLVIIMIPLFVTSFIKVRKNMKTASWKKLHRFSYLAYLLIYVHIVFVNLSSGDIGHIIISTMVYGLYFVLRIIKFAKNREV